MAGAAPDLAGFAVVPSGAAPVLAGFIVVSSGAVPVLVVVVVVAGAAGAPLGSAPALVVPVDAGTTFSAAMACNGHFTQSSLSPHIAPCSSALSEAM